jgi:hypothetical protein
MFEWILTIEQLHTPIHLAMLLQQEPNWSIKPWSHGAKSTWPGPWAPPRCVLFWSSPQPFKKPTSPARKIAATWLTYWPSDPLLFWNRTWWTWNLGFGMYHVFFFYNIFWLTAPPISDASQTTNGWWWCSLHRPSVCACIVYILYNYILNTHTPISPVQVLYLYRGYHRQPLTISCLLHTSTSGSSYVQTMCWNIICKLHNLRVLTAWR